MLRQSHDKAKVKAKEGDFYVATKTLNGPTWNSTNSALTPGLVSINPIKRKAEGTIRNFQPLPDKFELERV